MYFHVLYFIYYIYICTHTCIQTYSSMVETETQKNRERDCTSTLFTLGLILYMWENALENKNWKKMQYVNYDCLWEIECG